MTDEKRLRPARGAGVPSAHACALGWPAGGKSGGAGPPSARERGWGPASSKIDGGAVLLTFGLPVTAVAQPARTESVRALMQLARTQVQEGKAPAALDSLRKARALAPNSEEVLSAFAQVALTARATRRQC